MMTSWLSPAPGSPAASRSPPSHPRGRPVWDPAPDAAAVAGPLPSRRPGWPGPSRARRPGPVALPRDAAARGRGTGAADARPVCRSCAPPGHRGCGAGRMARPVLLFGLRDHPRHRPGDGHARARGLQAVQGGVRPGAPPRGRQAEPDLAGRPHPAGPASRTSPPPATPAGASWPAACASGPGSWTGCWTPARNSNSRARCRRRTKTRLPLWPRRSGSTGRSNPA